MQIKPKFIPKTKTRLVATSSSGIVGIEEMNFRESFRRKKEELVTTINQEAQNLQGVIEEKQKELEQVNDLSFKKQKLLKQIDSFNKSIEHAKQLLQQESDVKSKFIESSKKEADKEKERLLELKKQNIKLSERVEELNSVIKDLEGSIQQEEKAKVDYEQLKLKLAEIKKENIIVSEDTKQKLEIIEQKNKDLDNYKEVMKDMSGVLTTSLRIVTEATIELNRMLKENNIPLSFQLPPGELKEIKIYSD